MENAEILEILKEKELTWKNDPSGSRIIFIFFPGNQCIVHYKKNKESDEIKGKFEIEDKRLSIEEINTNERKLHVFDVEIIKELFDNNNYFRYNLSLIQSGMAQKFYTELFRVKK